MTDVDTVERVAKAINGPRDAAHIGTEKLHELQDYKWINQTTPQERIERLSAARAAIAALPPAVPQCIHMTAEMAQNCPTCNPSPFTTPDPVSEDNHVCELHRIMNDTCSLCGRALTKDGEAG